MKFRNFCVILIWILYFFSVAPSKRQNLTTTLQQMRLFHKTPKQIFLFNLFQVSKHWMNTDKYFVKHKYNCQHVSSPKYIEEMRHPSCYINVTLESLSKYLEKSKYWTIFDRKLWNSQFQIPELNLPYLTLVMVAMLLSFWIWFLS